MLRDVVVSSVAVRRVIAEPHLSTFDGPPPRTLGKRISRPAPPLWRVRAARQRLVFTFHDNPTSTIFNTTATTLAQDDVAIAAKRANSAPTRGGSFTTAAASSGS